MVDPAGIHTRPELHAAVGKLVRDCGVSYQSLSNRAKDVAPNTIHDWVSGKTFPRWTNLALLLKACGVTDTTMWRAAHTRAQNDTLTRQGRLLAEVTDPFEMEVHRPISEGPVRGLPPLPPYVHRAHDEHLARIVRSAAEGASAMAVLLAGSSTGKTRALWEALIPLRERAGWRVWHPRSPSRQEELSEGLRRVGPRTVVWLNETQRYFQGQTAAEQERSANALLGLLTDSRRAPVLILGTMWHEHYNALCGDPGTATRRLLDGAVITVPPVFSGVDLEAMRRAAEQDPRLAQAFARATRSGQITQYLAGGPELIDRYEHQVTEAARVAITAAIDAVRLGHRNVLPHALLHDAAAAYMSEDFWDSLAENWFELVLAETSQPCKGARGPISPIRGRRIGHTADRRGQSGPGVPVYQLADYLDQYGRRQRAGIIPPVEFWDAAAIYAAADDQHALAKAAWNRGLYRCAAQLWKNASDHGHPAAAQYLIDCLGTLFPHDSRPAAWVAARATVDDPDAVVRLLEKLRAVGAEDQAQHLAARAAPRAAVDDPERVVWLLEELRAVGADDPARNLAIRAAAEAAVDNPGVVAKLLDTLRAVGADDQARNLAIRAATDTAVDNPRVDRLLDTLRAVGADDQARNLAIRAATEAAVDDPYAVVRLFKALRAVGADVQARHLSTRAASDTALNRPGAVAKLLYALVKAGADNQAQHLSTRAASDTALNRPGAVAKLLYALVKAGADNQARHLAIRAASEAAVDDPDAVVRLFEALRDSGMDEQAQHLAIRAATDTAVDDPGAVAKLLYALSKAGTDAQAQHLAARVIIRPGAVVWMLMALQEAGAKAQVQQLATLAAIETALDDPREVIWLLETLRRAGADVQARHLATRAAAEAAVDDPEVVSLLDALRKAGADAQTQKLATRLAAHITARAADVAVDHPWPVVSLLAALRAVGADAQARHLAIRAATNTAVDDPDAVVWLMDELRKAGADAQARHLATRAATNTAVDHPYAVARLLDALRRAGADAQVRHLATRAAAEAAVDDPDAVVWLLNVLREAGVDAQTRHLATRAAAEAAVDDLQGAVRLLSALQDAGAHEAQVLIDRLPALGMFDLFLNSISDRSTQFGFGREPASGAPAERWTWEDLN
ncbi:hypothetical protein [Nocardia sp. NPDC005825]|uniref:hypothetical protein n=1 Tax=unclassified Nocardia TaxID=2637762 RepID=UPI003411CD97